MSDSNTRRKPWESLSTKSKNAWTAARTRCLLSVVDRRAWRTPRDEAVDVTLQDCDVQFEFAWEMLVQNWLADTGTFGDLVHAGRVVPVRNEYLTCSCEELEAARIAGEAGAATCSGRLASRCTAIGVSPIREFCHVASNLSKSNSVGARIRESRVRTRQYPPSHRS